MNRGLGKRACALVLTAAVGAVGVSGCDEADDIDEEVLDEGRDAFRNGVFFNGVFFNGVFFNSISFGSLWTQAVPGWLHYLQFYLNGTYLTDPQMNGNTLMAFMNGDQIMAADMEGAILDVDYYLTKETLNADLVQFLLEQLLTLTTGVGTELTAFHVKWRMPGFEELMMWQPTCPDGSPAVILGGTWDTNTWTQTSSDGMTLACMGGALADCALWGYDPDASYSGEELAAYHAACIRAKPADYCGNATPHTETGTPVDFYDDLNILTPGSTWDVEAMWDENGAICLSAPRKLDYTKDPMGTIYIGCILPDCVDVDGDGDIDFDDYPTAKIATRAIPS